MSKLADTDPASLTLKPLVPSDVTQTIEEWKISAIHYIAKSGHGTIASYIKTDIKPTAPAPLGREPTKPSTELLPFLQARWSALPENIVVAPPALPGQEAIVPVQPAPPDPANIVLVPPALPVQAAVVPVQPTPPDLLSFMEIWGDEMAAYNSKKTEHQRLTKIFDEFPTANRNAYPFVRLTLSDSAFEHIKKDPDCALAIESSDAFGLFQAAITLIDFTDPRVADGQARFAASQVKQCKHMPPEPVSTYASRLEDRIEQHIKASPDTTYPDLTRRTLLEEGLSKVPWTEWFAIRTAAGTLPHTYEGLRNLVITEDSKARYMTATSEDIKSGTVLKSELAANASNADVTGGRTKKLPVSDPCTFHLSLGQDRIAGTHNTANCRELKALKESAAAKQSSRGKDGKAKDKDKKSSSKKHRATPAKVTEAHTTRAADSDDSDADSDNFTIGHVDATEEQDVCINSQTEYGDFVYLDNCATGSTLRDADLAHNISDDQRTTRVTGILPGNQIFRTHGDFACFGSSPISTTFGKNLLSWRRAESAGYEITTVKDVNRRTTAIHAHKPGCTTLIFSRTEHGLYALSSAAFKAALPSYYPMQEQSAQAQDVIDVAPKLTLTAVLRDRALLSKLYHDGSLCHLSAPRTKDALKHGLFVNSPISGVDVDNANYLYGPCPICIAAKGTRPPTTGHFSDHPTVIGEKLVADIFYIWGHLLFLTSDRLVHLKIGTFPRGKSTKSLLNAVTNVVNRWKGYGRTVKEIASDREAGLLAAAPQIFAELGVTIIPRTAEGHEKLIEREGRTVKEAVYAVAKGWKSRGMRIPKVAIPHIIGDVLTIENRSPNSQTYPESPMGMLQGTRLDLTKIGTSGVGTFGMFWVPYRKAQDRRELGIIIGHENYNPIVLTLPEGTVAVVRDRRFEVLPDHPKYVDWVNELRDADGITEYENGYNDLEKELREHADDSYDPRIQTPVAAQYVPSAHRPPTQVTGAPPLPAVTPLPTNRAPPVVESARSVPPLIAQHQSEPSLPPANSHVAQPPPVHVPAPQPAVQQQPVVSEGRPRRAGAERPEGFYNEKRLASHRVGAVAAETCANDVHVTHVSIAEAIDELLTANQMSHREAASRHGIEKQVEAALDEVVGILGDGHKSGTMEPVLPKSLSKLERNGALRSFMLYKEKMINPNEEVMHTSTHGGVSPAKHPKLPSDDDLSDVTDDANDWTKVLSRKDKKKAVYRIKLKARLVGNGAQQDGVDKSNMVAPTARAISHKLLLNICAYDKADIRIGDVPKAYLNAKYENHNGKQLFVRLDKITADIAVKRYPRLKDYLLENGEMICKVNKALYGLVESAWLWFREVSGTVLSHGFSATPDLGVYTRREGNDYVHLSLHVDDFFGGSSHTKRGLAMHDEIWSALNTKYPGIKIQRGPNYMHLGHSIKYERKLGVIYTDQNQHTRGVLKKQGITHKESYPCRADLLTGQKKKTALLSSKRGTAYRAAVAEIAYIDRPDVKFTASVLQKYASAPCETDMDDLMHLFGYLNAHPDCTFKYEPRDLQLRGYVDASWDTHSHYGYVLTIGGENNACIASKSGRIRVVTRSSTEAEIHAVNEVSSEVLWCIDLLEALGVQQAPVCLKEDNQSCITMMQSDPRNFQTKSKHVRVKWNFFREQFKHRQLYLEYCKTDDMRADMLTKPLVGKQFIKHIGGMLNQTPVVLKKRATPRA